MIHLTASLLPVAGEPSRFVPVDLPLDAPAGSAAEEMHGAIPFRVVPGAALDLQQAGWPGWKADFGGSYDDYDSQEPAPDPEGRLKLYRMQVPRADYLAAHFLVEAPKPPEAGRRFTLRIGRWIGGAGVQSQVLRYDFSGQAATEQGGGAQTVRIPVTEAFSQDVEGDLLDLELTKEIRLARRLPDPSRFRWMPLGTPCEVKVRALTLEKSPLQMEVTTPAPAATFVQPEKAELHVRLTNITTQPRRFRLSLTSGDHPPRQEEGVVEPGASVRLTVPLPTQAPGYHAYRLELRDAEAGALPGRNGSWMLLPPDRRRNPPPFGLGAGRNGVHFSPRDPEMSARLFNRLGIRHADVLGDGQAIPYELRKKHGLVNGCEFSWRPANLRRGESLAEKFTRHLREHPDLIPWVMLLHEDSISAAHSMRVPDLFVDGPRYRLDPEEQERLALLRRLITESAAWFRKEHPEVRLLIGNGNLGVREELYRSGLPAESFDAAGNECGSFSRPPETQPPDTIGSNASLWMDRQMLDAYGYPDKPVAQGWEVHYPSTNPGNLSLRTHADYIVRHRLHALAWRVPKISGGGLYDYGNSYALGNWGSSGHFTGRPHPMPKPAALALATLTRALDDVAYRDFVPTGSDSLYLMRFTSPSGSQVLPFWVVRGERTLHLWLEGSGGAQWITPQGETVPLARDREGRLQLRASASPAYLLLAAGVRIARVEAGEPEHPGADRPPQGAAFLGSLATLGEHGWRLLEARNPLLENYNPLTPRRKGGLALETGDGEKHDGKPVLHVTPMVPQEGRATMPMYAELEHARGLPLPGEPDEIGIMVNGNSGWGRLIFELEDASGQRWTSIGAQAQQGKAEWMADWIGRDAAQAFEPGMRSDWNTEDPWSLSRINFDGWRHVAFPLPGQYPGEGYHWPSNSQWKWDGDGRVHYPLTLKKVILQLPEKVLYLTRFEPPARKRLTFGGIYSARTGKYPPKRKPFRYLEAYQISHR
ncbi:MAG TPA: hypothetical protein VNQ90_15825 [Chthoniobacteraceae bacterium]|nr:hypothetical protein [Chthoniobacteraceae bacterium]